MALQKRELKVGDNVYALILPPASAAMVLVARSTVLVGSFGKLLADIKTLGDISKDKEARLGACLDKLGEALKEVDPLALSKLTMDAVYAAHLCFNNTPISEPNDFDRHFDERRGELYQVTLWCLWECISDFFPVLGTFTRLQEKAKEMFPFRKDGQ